MSLLAKNLALFLAYTLLAKGGLVFGTVSGNGTLVWPAGGIALACVLLWGPRLLPAVYLGAFAAGLSHNLDLFSSVLTAVGNALETALAFWLLTRRRFNPALESIRDYVTLIVFGAAIPVWASAIIGPYALTQAGMGADSSLLVFAFKWWMGDFLGIVFFTPLLLLALAPRHPWEISPGRRAQLLLWPIAFVIGMVVFLGWGAAWLGSFSPRPAWVFLLCMIGGVLLSRRNMAFLQLMFLLQGLAGAYLGVGFFANDLRQTGLAGFWAFAMVLASGGMLLAIVSFEKAHALWRVSLSAKVFEMGEYGVLITDAQNNIQQVNPAFTRITGYSEDEVHGKNPRLLSSGAHNPEFYRCLWHTVQFTGRWTGEIWNRRKSGELFLERLSVHTLYDEKGRAKNRIGIFSDVTQEHQANKALQAARDAAEQANRAKSQFLANMSHEIRTPMNAIIGFTDLALDGADADTTQNYLRHIRSAGRHLLGIINDILNLSKIEAGKLVLSHETFSLHKILEQACATASVAAKTKSLLIEQHVESNIPDMLQGDPMRLLEILNNLLSNAVKFTAKGGVRLAVSAEDASPAAITLCISVKDTGIGLSPAQIRTIFEPFNQGDNSISRQYGGTGLGLSITRRLCQMMRGEISVTSTPGQGATFTATVRLAVCRDCTTPDSASPDAVATKPGQGQRILIVEDNPVNQMVARHLIEKMGFSVTCSDSGAEAVALLDKENHGVDAVLMDVQMPGMSGLEATALIRLRHSAAGLPIIALTANAYDDDRKRCLAVGMTDFVAKPIAPEVLRRALVNALGLDKK